MRRRADLLSRIILPKRGGLAPELAKYILSLDFPPQDHERYRALSAKAQAGSLSKREAAELDEYLSTNSLLMVLQSKARVSLAKQSSAA
jgi:hypothetical protein